MKTIKANVKTILTEHPETRDDNGKLINWYYILFAKVVDKSYLSFIGMLIRKEIPTPDTITRLSRQLQEQNPELRGKYWRQRKTVKVLEVQKDLGYNVKAS